MPVDPALVLGFLALSALLSAIPGPSVVLETSRAITRGRGSAMWIVLGNAAGGMVLLGLVVSGLGVLVTASEGLFWIVKLLGAAYLVWLGLKALAASRSASADELGAPGSVDVVGAQRPVRQGFVVGVGNPKSIVSLMAVLPQFVDPARGHVTLQLAVMGILGGIAQVVIESCWVCAASALRTWFLRRPRRIRAVKAAGGVAMIGLAGRLAVER